MRRALDGLYALSGAIAAAFLLAIALIVLVQVAFNTIDKLALSFGFQAVGLSVPSYAEFAGYFLVSATFFAAASALQHGAHVRVGLVIERLGPGARRAAEIWCAGLGATISGYFTFWTGVLVEESLRFGDVSPGIVPTPIWIPQMAMPLGLAVLTIAFLDRLAQMLAGPRSG